MQRRHTSSEGWSGEHEIRRYRSADKDSYLELYETVYSPKSEQWFDWRYAAPSLDHVPIFVAIADGNVVGAEAFLPFRLRAAGEMTLALQPADAMVHPEHRRQGLFSRITETAIDYYSDQEPTHFFNFPTPAAKPALQKLGWREVGQVPTWFRIQNPRPLLSDAVAGKSLAAASRSAKALLGTYYRSRIVLSKSDSLDVHVERIAGAPPSLLTGLATQHQPSLVSVHRDEEFYQWRFANPRWDDVSTYVARRDGDPVSAIVTATHRTLGMSMTKLLDAVPRGGDDRSDELAAILDTIIDDAADRDLLAVTDSTLPADLLGSRGFLSDEYPPASWLCTPTDMVVRPVADGDDGWHLGEHSLTDRENWIVTFADQDTPF